MPLITYSDIQNATNLHGARGDFHAKRGMKPLKLDKINSSNRKIEGTSGSQFLNEIFQYLNIQVDIPDGELSRIPKSGAFIVVSNHPYGGLDGLILLKMIQSIRPDFKIMSNHLLNKIDPLSDSFLVANPFERKISDKSSYAAVKKIQEHLAKDGGIGIFPSGEVSTFQLRQQSVVDKEWSNSAIALIQKAKVPVTPIYFHGANSTMFQLLSLFHKNLQTAKLPSELLKKKNKVIQMRIGKSISLDKQQEFIEIDELGRYLRAKTYYLGKPLKVNSFFRKNNLRLKVEAPIAPPIPQADLMTDRLGLPKQDLLFKFKRFEVYCSSACRIPSILKEIGRLREVSFRAIGEGSNKPVDLDEYDLYYNHLFIWDVEGNKIVGAYRIGHGPDIHPHFGKGGFYLNSLFKIKGAFEEVLRHSMELGRSFIVPEYQKNPYALFILWKGILHYLLKNEEIKYVLGPVSISNQYSKVSQSLMIDFIKDNYFDQAMAACISPRNRFKYTKSKNEAPLKTKNIKELESLIEEMEPMHFKLPILLKKYLKQNARIIGFNVDPKFNDTLDGLMYLNINHLNQETIQMLTKEVEDPSVLERFRNIPQ